MSRMFVAARGDSWKTPSTLQIAGFIDDDVILHGRMVFGYPVLGGFADLEGICLEQGITGVFVGLGDRAMARRKTYYQVLQTRNLVVRPAIHPKAAVEHNLTIGRGSLISIGVSVNIDTRIGENVFVATGGHISHDCVVENHCYLGPGVTLCGYACIGDNSFVGAGATVLPRVKVGHRCIIGAGSLVNRNIPDGKVAYGIPARIIRDND